MTKKINCKIVSFTYHEVVDDPSASGIQRKSALPYKHSLKEFTKHLHEIYRSETTKSIVINTNMNSTEKHILLTFDDGGKSAMYIADVLEEYGWKGHFFITTSFIGKIGFLTRENIRDLNCRGHVVGSHSHTHPDIFYNLTYEDMLEEWIISTTVLSDIIQGKVECASIPGGEMNLSVQSSAQEAGIKYLFTSEPTNVPWVNNKLFCLGRVCPKVGTSYKKVYKLANHQGIVREIAIRRIKNFIKRIYYPLIDFKRG